MSRLKGPAFPSWRRRTDVVEDAKTEYARREREAAADRKDRVPGRSLPCGHSWVPHEKSSGGAAARRRRQMARDAAKRAPQVVDSPVIADFVSPGTDSA